MYALSTKYACLEVQTSFVNAVGQASY